MLGCARAWRSRRAGRHGGRPRWPCSCSSGPALRRARPWSRRATTLLAEARLMARVVEPSRWPGARPRRSSTRWWTRAAREVRARVTDRGPGRPGARRFRRCPAPRSPRSRTTPPGRRCRPRSAAARARRPATARPCSDELLYAAVPVRHDGPPAGRRRASPCRSRSVEERRCASSARAVGLALLLAFAITAVLSPRSSPRRLAASAARDHGRGPAVRGRQPRRAHPRAPRATSSASWRRILNHSADQLQERLHGDRPRARAHRRHPLGDGGRRARRGPPGHRAPGQRRARRQPRPRASPWAATTSR